MLLWAAAPVLADDPFQSAPGPVAPKPKPRPHAPAPEAEPAAVPPAATPAAPPVANPLPARPLGQLAGAFDGTYSGSVTAATAASAGRHRNCFSGGTVRMIITAGAVLIQQGGRPNGGTANYRGLVDSGGAVSASATNPEGIVHTVTGKINQARFTGEIRRTNCYFSVDLVKG